MRLNLFIVGILCSTGSVILSKTCEAPFTIFQVFFSAHDIIT